MGRFSNAARAAWGELRKAGGAPDAGRLITATQNLGSSASMVGLSSGNAGLTGFGLSTPTPEQEQALREQGMQTGGAFSPGRPIQQFFPQGMAPRQWDFPVGYNVGARPRANERGRPSFDTLKAIIDAWDVARLCIDHIKRDLRSFELRFVPHDGIEDDVSDQVAAARKFWAKPDGQHSFDSWLSLLLEDLLRYDAPVLYRNRTRAGALGGLDVVSGVTVAPLLDYYGRRPTGLAPAFVQFVSGVPALWLTADALIYEPFMPLPESPYGLPPMEWLLLTANTDIRFQWYFLQFFSSGNIPDTFMEAPPDQSDPEQIIKFQAAWDAIMEGDQSQLHKVKWVPAGSKPAFHPQKNFDEAFPLYLTRKTAAAFGITPHDLGIVQDVNRSTGETQVDVQFRIGTQPLLNWFAGLATEVTNDDLGLPSIKAEFDTGREKEDRYAEAQAMDLYVKMGALSPDEVRRDIHGKETDPEHPVPRFIFSPRAGAIPLKSIEEIAGQIDPATAAPEPDSITQAEDVQPGEYVAPTGVIAQPDDLRTHRQAAAAPSTPPVAGQQPEEAATGIGGAGPVSKGVGPTAAGLAVKAHDTGRVLMIQRALVDDDPAAGTWEFPGGHVEDGEAPLAAAIREWGEETGARLPPGRPAATWTSPNGVYKGYVYVIAREADLDINLDHEDRHVLNPDDPDGDAIEVAAWFDPLTLPTMPSLRPECWTTDWTAILNADDFDGVAKALDRWRANALQRVGQGLAVRRFRGEWAQTAGVDVPRADIAAVWSRLEKAATAEEVDAAFRLPFVKAAQEPLSRRPLHQQVSAAEEHYADQIRAALAGSLDPEAAAAGWLAQHPVRKAAGDPGPTADDFRAAAEAYVRGLGVQGDLEQALLSIYGDGWLLGLGAAAIAAEQRGLNIGSTGIDWSAWKPGSEMSAAILDDANVRAGIAELQGQGIAAGIDATTMEEIASRLATGAANGDSVQTIAASLREFLDSDSRATSIAHTELNRAMSQASLDAYRANDITGKGWMTFNPCPLCARNEAAGVIPVGQAFPSGDQAPPGHNRCRCSIYPSQLSA